MTIGNDLVDLSSLHARSTWNNMRWGKKVFSKIELSNISNASDPALAFWKSWAMKECCYKVISKNLGVSFYNFLNIEVDLNNSLCRYNNEDYMMTTEVKEGVLHTITTPSDNATIIKDVLPRKSFDKELILKNISLKVNQQCQLYYDSRGIPHIDIESADISFSYDMDIASFYFSISDYNL